MKRVGIPCALVILSIVGCVSSPVALKGSAPWTGACYLSIDEDTRRIAGGDITDCGLVAPDATTDVRQAVEECARRAVDRAGGFRFGYASFGDDSAYCHVAIRSTDGQIWDFFYDNDVTGQLGKNGNHSTVWLSRCRRVEFRPSTLGRGSFFGTEECSRDEEAEQTYIWAHHVSIPR